MPAQRSGDATPPNVGEPEKVIHAFDKLPLAVAATMGAEHRFVAANETYRALAGRSDLIGLPLRAAFPEFAGQRVYEMYDAVYADNRAQVGHEWRMQVADADGELHDKYFDFVVSPLTGDDDTVVGLTAHGVDVTDRVRQRLADQARTAEAERRYTHARDVLMTLQRELLPAGLPLCAGAALAGSYMPADVETAAGGDWFDAVPLPNGKVALVVGDVVGHGVSGSATMGQLRAVLVDRLGSGNDIPTALAAVDRMARGLPEARAATACVAVLDQHAETLQYCTAGHPPPLVISADGTARYLPETGAGPLATGSAFPVAEDTLADGDVLLCYSDGIIERPGTTLVASRAELAQTAADVVAGRAFISDEPFTVERVCKQTLELLVRSTGHRDDITVLAARRHAPSPDLDVSAPAELSTVTQLRERLRGWLAGLGAAEHDAFALQHAVSELVTNSVEHAYAGRSPGQVRLHAEVTASGTARITVSDDGRWHEPGWSELRSFEPERSERPSHDHVGDQPVAAEAPLRGRGLAMSRELVEHLEVSGSAQGTTATITHRLVRPVHMVSPADIPGDRRSRPPTAQHQAPLQIVDQTSPRGQRIQLIGPLDAHTADELRVELQHRTRGGTRQLVLDLSGVTHLASAAVATLTTAWGETATGFGTAHSGPLCLYAPSGSPAAEILTVVAVPHVTDDPHHHPAAHEHPATND